MAEYTWENPPVNGIEHEKQDEIKECKMLSSRIFDHETKHDHSYDFVRGVKETSSIINEGVKLHSHVYDGKDAHSHVHAGYGNIKFQSQSWVWQHSDYKGIHYPHHVC